MLASLADAKDEETVRHFVRLLLIWLYYNGRYQTQREDKMSIFVIKAMTDANQDGLKYVPVLCHVFAMNGDTLSYADTMSDADKLALELYVSEHYQIGTPHVLMKREFLIKREDR